MVVTTKNEPVPYIFFSYARADLDAYLERFFDDLSKRSAQVIGVGEAKFAFIDTNSIKTGQDWNTRIAAALQSTKVLVCVYSPNFFSKERTHEYCAKEFDAFLRRNTDLRYDRIVEGGRTIVRIRDARNIVPILWFGELDLTPQGLPPAIVQAITYSLNQIDAQIAGKISDTYQSNGMERFARRRGSTYREIIATLARVIRGYADQPLPPTPDPLDFATLRNAFWDPPPDVEGEAAAPSAALSIEHLATESPGPSRLFSIELRLAAGDDQPWTPFAGASRLSGLVDEVATSRRLTRTSATLDPNDAGFLERARNLLESASAVNTSVILFVHPECLAVAGARHALESLLATGNWRGGVMVPLDAADQPAIDVVMSAQTFFQLSLDQQQRIAMRTVTGSSEDFRAAMASLLDEVLARIVKHGDIRRDSPDNDGPTKRPSITNVGSAATDR